MLLDTLSSLFHSKQPEAKYKLSAADVTPTSTGASPNTLALCVETSFASFPLQWSFELEKCLPDEVCVSCFAWVCVHKGVMRMFNEGVWMFFILCMPRAFVRGCAMFEF